MIAERFAEAGARVVVHCGKEKERAHGVAERLSRVTQVDVVAADLTDPAAVEEMFASTAPYGSVDILVNNAGVYPSAPIADLSATEWAAVFRINVEAAFLCLQAAVPTMAAQGGGSIINIASLSATRPALHQSHYNSSKAALVALTRSAAVELAPHGIRVNSVSPGLVEREGLEEAWPAGVAQWRAHAPLSRLGRPVDVANACIFLASPLAEWITGHDLVVDGGMSATPAY